ncbi:hypothetical protein ACFQ0T_08375 [Kitasatospora gansuensis]
MKSISRSARSAGARLRPRPGSGIGVPNRPASLPICQATPCTRCPSWSTRCSRYGRELEAFSTRNRYQRGLTSWCGQITPFTSV